MDTDIRILSADLTEALQSYIKRRLHFSLGRFGRRVGRVKARITDVNGPRGGVGKSCHVSAELLPSGTTLIRAPLVSHTGSAPSRVDHKRQRNYRVDEHRDW